MHEPIVEVLMSPYCSTSRCPPCANKLKKHNTMMAGLRCCSKSANTVSISLDEPVSDYNESTNKLLKRRRNLPHLANG